MMRSAVQRFESAAPRLLATPALLAGLLTCLATPACAAKLPTAGGFYGIWYAVGASGDQYAYKYSGGLGTYTHQTSPLAIYTAEANRTYFVYGGTNGASNTLKNYISYFDHTTGLLARPREVRHVGGTDNHRNITFTIDDAGYLHVFGNSHGDGGTGNLYKSAVPYEIADFNEVPLPTAVFGNNSGKNVLSYSNPFFTPGKGFTVVYNQYHDGRAVHIATSPDGVNWSDRSLFDTNQGHYTAARQNGETIGVAADWHRGGSLDNRTNLYYFESPDAGTTWTNVSGTVINGPLTTVNNVALVYDYNAENKLVYMKDIDYDAAGNPILMYLTVSDSTGSGHTSGPKPGGRMIHTAHWTGSTWRIRDVVPTDHNYDHGELVVEPDGTWRLTAPFIDGPQQYGTGGEVGVWTSQNEGVSWQLLEQLTEGSQFNHTYVRHPTNAHDDFYSYWADGNAFAQSASRLYLAGKDGAVYRMPTNFTGDFAAPELVGPSLPTPTRAYEGFDYPGGDVKIAGRNGGSGWGGPWVDEDNDFEHLAADGQSLDSGPYPFAPVGRRVEGVGGEASRALGQAFNLAQDGNEFYASFLLKKQGGAATAGDNVEFNLNAGGAQVVRVGGGSNEQFFLGSSANYFADMTIDETYFLVLKGISSAAGSDQFFVKVYRPTDAAPESEPVEWDSQIAINSDAVIDAIRLVRGTNGSGAFDEIRIGRTWADVTAETPLMTAGDFNGDGNVDADDLAIWQQYYGASFGATAGTGDADLDGDIDGADFLIWQRNLSSAGANPATTPTPEPASAALAIAAALFGWGANRQASRHRSS